MDPNLAPPAPPPFQPITPSHDPYEFITRPSAPKKRGWLLGGTTKMRRIALVGAGAVILSLLVVIVIGLLGQSSSDLRADYLRLAQQQTELIRVSDIGISKAEQTETKNLALNIKLSLLSEQPDILKLAKKAGATTDPKTLNLGKNAQTDTLLTKATQNNQFDSVFTRIMQDSLKKYQETLKKIHDQSSSKTTKDILSKNYKNTDTLLGSTSPQTTQ